MPEPGNRSGNSSAQTAQPAAAPALLSVTRGAPTADELAALLVVLGGRAGQPAGTSPVRSPWSAPARLLRAPARPGPGAWRASAQPG